MIGYEGGYHSHDQYLQSWLTGGLPAFISPVDNVVENGVGRYPEKNILLCLLLFHFMIQSVSESTFEAAGTRVLYAVLIFIVLSSSKK